MTTPSEPAEERPAAPPPPRRYRIIEMSVALAAIVVSVAALVVAREQTQLMGKQLAASVWPVLDYTTSNTTPEGQPVVSLDLRNNGVGPTRIRSFRLTYDDQPVESTNELMRLCCSREYGPNSGLITSNVTGRVLAAGENLAFMKLPLDATRRPLFARLNDERFRIAIRTCYCSVLEDCWVLDSRQTEPEPVASCQSEAAEPQYR